MPNRERVASDNPRAEIRAKLRIDEDSLDACLVEQPEYFFQAAELSAEANSVRDTAKLELKELLAELDQDVRRKALEEEEKLSENAIMNRLTILPRVKELQRKVLQLSEDAEKCSVLKEAYIQRSYALKDLNAAAQARLYNLGVERGSTGTRRDAASRVEERQSNIRRERFRPGSSGD